jgi:hypothetical protein
VGGNPKPRIGVKLLKCGLPALAAILVLAPQTPVPPDPPHIDERQDPRPAETVAPKPPPAFDPGTQPGQAPVSP